MGAVGACGTPADDALVRAATACSRLCHAGEGRNDTREGRQVADGPERAVGRL
jgi:hypothetical protein